MEDVSLNDGDGIGDDISIPEMEAVALRVSVGDELKVTELDVVSLGEGDSVRDELLLTELGLISVGDEL